MHRNSPLVLSSLFSFSFNILNLKNMVIFQVNAFDHCNGLFEKVAIASAFFEFYSYVVPLICSVHKSRMCGSTFSNLWFDDEVEDLKRSDSPDFSSSESDRLSL